MKIAKSKLKDESTYRCRVSSPTEIAGKMRSPAHTLEISGALAKQHYEALKSISSLPLPAND